VLTRHPREPLEMQGGTTFNFVTDGIESALEQARAAAGDKDVDELHLHIVPILLGSGERLLDGVGDPGLEPVKVVASPAATHVKYRVVR
jgi:dihydrofolate reductase